ncbi:hypothetical protein RDABS01_028532 [Bienertia sinuspersici]
MELMGGNKIWEIVPFLSMFIMEGVTIALTITAKSAMAIGMSQFVFVAYSNALSSILLLAYCLIYHSDSLKKVFNVKLLSRFFLLGLTGITIAQNLAFTGLRDSSPIVVCAMGLLLPSFQFFLNLILRKAKLKLKSTSTRIKLVGIVISFIGGITVAVYLGPSILQGPIIGPILLSGTKFQFIFIATTEQWMFGTFLLGCATFFIAIWSMIQALFGTLVRSRIQAWCMSVKGPMYVAMFKPAGIFWANCLGESFFGTLCYGSVIGTIVVGVGYYTVLWGVREEAKKDQDDSIKSASSDIKTPLLQNQDGDEQV